MVLTGHITNSNMKRNGSTSSNYDRTNSNLRVRVQPFQEQRPLKRSTSFGTKRKTSQDRLRFITWIQE